MQMRGFTSVDFARLHPGGSLGRRLLMTVGNVMRDHDLPVVDKQGRYLGFISKSRILNAYREQLVKIQQ